MKNLRRVVGSIMVFVILFINTSMSYAEVDLDKLNYHLDLVGEYLYKTTKNPEIGSIGGEWAIIGLARSGKEIPDTYFNNYFTNVEKQVKNLKGNLHDRKYSEYSRVILALTSMGKDPRDIGGYNLLEKLSDYEAVNIQGINGPIWGLIALDSGQYDLVRSESVKLQASRDMYLDKILKAQLKNGGWSLHDEGIDSNVDLDIDITAMALQALSKYKDRKDIDLAINKALEALSKEQNISGGFSSWQMENSESIAQVIVALGELDVDLDDARFVKNGNTLLDGLYRFYSKNNGFNHTLEEDGSSQMATEQGFYALVSAQRNLENKKSLFDMSDKKEVKSKVQEVREDKLDKKITFNDLKGQTSEKEEKAILILANKGIINGKDKEVFSPRLNMTRAEFATIIVKALNLDLIEANKFKDVQSKDWFYKYVGTANENGIVNGISEGYFNPNGNISKEEAVSMIVRGISLKGLDTNISSDGARDILSQFDDYMVVNNWSRSSLAYAYYNKILDDSSMNINPKGICNRAEIAEMIYNMLALID